MASERKRKYSASAEHTDESSEASVYLDYNATTPLSPSVIRIITETLSSGWGNPSSSYSSGITAKNIIETSRLHLTSMLNGNSMTEIIFMSGGTEANNHVIWNAIQYFQEWKTSKKDTRFEKPHIITSVIEHDSILCPLRRLENEKIASVTYVPVSEELGYIDPADVAKEIRDETVLVTIMMANNETGTMQLVQEISQQISRLNIAKRSHLPQVLVHTDAAQTIGKVKVDVRELAVDYVTIVGHKFYGPRIGALWVKTGSPYYPMLLGGGQEKGKRAGTENTCMIAGLGEAARLVTENVWEYNTHFKEICSYLQVKLKETFHEDVKFNCYHSDNLPNTLNVSFTGRKYRGRDIIGNCNYTEASVGAACHTNDGDKPSAILLAHHVQFESAVSAVRLSVGRSTSKKDIDTVVSDLKHAIRMLDQKLQ